MSWISTANHYQPLPITTNHYQLHYQLHYQSLPITSLSVNHYRWVLPAGLVHHHDVGWWMVGQTIWQLRWPHRPSTKAQVHSHALYVFKWSKSSGIFWEKTHDTCLLIEEKATEELGWIVPSHVVMFGQHNFFFQLWTKQSIFLKRAHQERVKMVFRGPIEVGNIFVEDEKKWRQIFGKAKI